MKGEGNRMQQRGKHLSVTVCGERYGVPVLQVKEIIEHGGVVRMPFMPGFICGAINLRGHGVPVVDLAQRLGAGNTVPGRRTCIVIVEAGAPERRFDVGLLVDAVNEVFDLDESQIEETPSFDGQIRTDFLRGMGKRGNDFIVLLSLEHILDLSDVEQFHDAMKSGLPSQDRCHSAKTRQPAGEYHAHGTA